jgi:hypothetical protein
VILGWFAAHQLTARRDRINKRRELRAKYLIEVWRKLERSRVRPEGSNHAELEEAVADLQLFGTPHQVELARRFCLEMAGEQQSSPDQLLLDLRNDLRRDLGLAPVSAPIQWLRLHPKPSADAATRAGNQAEAKPALSPTTPAAHPHASGA